MICSSCKQRTQLLRQTNRIIEELRARDQRRRVRGGRHDDIHKRILLRWYRTGRVLLGGQHLHAHPAGLHRPVSGNQRGQVRKPSIAINHSSLRFLRYYTCSSRNFHFVAFFVRVRSVRARTSTNGEKNKREERKKRGTELRMRSGLTRDRNVKRGKGEERKKERKEERKKRGWT